MMRSALGASQYALHRNLQLAKDYGERHAAHEMAETLASRFEAQSIEAIFEVGLHEFVESFIAENNALGTQIEKDYRFYE